MYFRNLIAAAAQQAASSAAGTEPAVRAYRRSSGSLKDPHGLSDSPPASRRTSKDRVFLVDGDAETGFDHCAHALGWDDAAASPPAHDDLVPTSSPPPAHEPVEATDGSSVSLSSLYSDFAAAIAGGWSAQPDTRDKQPRPSGHIMEDTAERERGSRDKRVTVMENEPVGSITYPKPSGHIMEDTAERERGSRDKWVTMMENEPVGSITSPRARPTRPTRGEGRRQHLSLEAASPPESQNGVVRVVLTEAARSGGGGGGGGDGGDRGGDEQVPSPRQRYRSRYRAASSVAGTVQGDDEFFGSNDGSLIPAERRTLDRMLRGSRLLDTDAGVRDELRDAHAAVREAKLAAEALRKQQQQRQADRAAEEAAEAELAAAKAAALAEARRAERERLDAESGALQAKAQEPVEAMDGYSDFAAAIGGGGGGDGGDRGGDEQVPSPRQRYRSRYRAGSSVMGDDEIFGGDGGSLIPAERRTLGRMLRPSRLLDSDAGLRDELPGAQAVVAAVPPPEQNCLDDSESTLQRFRTQLDTAREAVGLAVRTLVGPELRA